MPTLPLYDTTADPDGYHRVRAPGGYEWWHLGAESASRHTSASIDFFDGDPFDTAYLAAYARYLRRPTRVPPPLPRDYPRVRVRVNGQTICDATDPIVVSAEGPEIRIGSSVLRRDGGVVRLSLASEELTFTPILRQAVDVREFAGDVLSAVHVRVIKSPSYDVSGILRGIPFEGRGNYIHYFGTGPIGKTEIY
jgi:hypothetical protein